MIFLSWSGNVSTIPLQENTGGLKAPGWFHFSRLIQLFLCFGMFYFFYSMRDMKLISKIVNFYISCFTLICLLGLFFYLIALFTRDSNIFALYKGFSINGIVLPRMLTPFHSEPGPFGTFLVSSTLMAFILLRRKSFYIQLLSIFLTFSTLGIITLIISLVFYFSRKNIIYGLVFAFIFSSPLIFIKEIQPIFSWKIQQLIYNSAEHTKYGGRFAGMIIAPNMISEKPILGIGWEKL